MKKSELIHLLSHMRDDAEIVVQLHQPGVGGTPTTSIETVSSGFDWDNGKIIFSTKDKVVTQEHLDRIQKYCRAFEKLLYLYAIENNMEYMGKPLMGHSSLSAKGTTVRAFKEYMKKHVNEYLGNN